MFVLVNNYNGKYVTPPGMERSYTFRLEEARIFATEDAALKERCDGSEHVAPLTSLLMRPES